MTEDTVLDPGKTYGAIVVRSSGITIDGRGAWLVGPCGPSPAAFRGVAVSAEGVSRVTVKNVRAKGWETGLRVTDGAGWTIEDCDFSDNFHAPEFGWGENGRRGGIVLERVRNSTRRRNTANRVWDACVLVESDDNTIADNDFSHTSNTCHNSPHLLDGRHAGIVFMFGSSSHTVARKNRCAGNNGARIALIGDEGSQGARFKAFHWILEENEMVDNQWGSMLVWG